MALINIKILFYPFLVVGTPVIAYFALVGGIKGEIVVSVIVIATLAAAVFAEMLYPYRKNIEHGTSKRDIAFTVLNLAVLAVAGPLTISLLSLVSENLLHRSTFLEPEIFGVLWLQTLVALFAIDFLRYSIHYAQHRFEFLWKFHSRHHSVKKLYSMNGFYSEPFDLYLRHGVPVYILTVIGFDLMSMALALSLLSVIGVFSHCATELEFGFFNKFITTSQVHRWHHSDQLGMGKNFAPSLAFIDRIFGTYYFESKSLGPETMGLNPIITTGNQEQLESIPYRDPQS